MLDLSLGNDIFINNIFDAAIQELDIMFSTEPCELIGYPQYGCIFENFLWSMTPNAQSIKDYIESKINLTYFAKQIKHNINVSYEWINEEFIYYVQIEFFEEGKRVKDKIYEIQNYH